MAHSTTHRPTHPAGAMPPPTPTTGVAPVVPPAATPHPTPFMPLRHSFVTDDNLVMSLRQIYQSATSWRPVPSGTVLSDSLTGALERIADIAKQTVEAYKPPE